MQSAKKEIEPMSETPRTWITLVLIAAVTSLCAVRPASAAVEKADADEVLAKVDSNDISFYHRSASTEPYPHILRSEGQSVRNVIFLIGDGMGLGQVALARMKGAGTEGKLYMERLPITGLVRTHSADNLVTDSAASGTALACGVKTRNKMIGMTRGGTLYRTILEAAQAKGMATGLVVTSTISHATPASFAAHVKNRDQEDVIAEQLLAAKVNVLLGGGRQFFLPSSDPNGPRKDNRNLIEEARQAGYMYVETADELQNVQAPYVLGLFAMSHMTTVAPEPPLAVMAKKAVDLLQDKRTGWFVRKRGFFLMIEGSQIDFACHKNNAPDCIRQTLLFDQAVEVAMEFALQDRHTLVLVTADHETGGLTIPSGNLRGTRVKAAWSSTGHTATPVPVYAFGPGAGTFVGVYDNTELSKKLAELMGIKPWPQRIE
jgi:alkaline phosphatase